MILGLPAIFEWSHADAINNPIIRMKSPYLNAGFFMIRAIVYFVSVAVMCVGTPESTEPHRATSGAGGRTSSPDSSCLGNAHRPEHAGSE